MIYRCVKLTQRMENNLIPQAVDVLDVTDRQWPDNDIDRLSFRKLVVLSLLSGLLWVPIGYVVWILF